MFTLQQIYKSYSDKTILENISFSLHSGEVIALVGENGAGKTTLLQIMLGHAQPDSGVVTVNGEVVGYIPQESKFSGAIQDCFDLAKGWCVDYALSAVGLSAKSKNTPVNKLSGGQRTRLALARVLAHDPVPTILLLDEPTNNLDNEGLAWLEDFICTFQGGIVLASHDRSFINRVATKVVELKNGSLKQYGGNYDFYVQQRQIEYQAALDKYEQTQADKKRLKKVIASHSEKGQHIHKHIKRSDNDKFQRDFFRNRVARKTGQRTKALTSQLERIEHVEKPEFAKMYKITLDTKSATNKRLASLCGVSKSYDSHSVMQNVSLEIRGDDRIHLTGLNGSGKTTLLKIAAKLVRSDAGEVIWADKLRIGYFAQDASGVDLALSGYDNLQKTGSLPGDIYRQARSMGLGTDDLKKMPNELSRGQQAKLAFAKLLLSHNDLLILDEPTNHLDIPTKERIEEALRDYTGALLVVSHDLYFVDAIGVNRTITTQRESNPSQQIVANKKAPQK